MQETVKIIHKSDLAHPDYLITLTLTYEEEEGFWAGVCLETNTTSFSETFEGIRRDLIDAVLLQLNEIEQLGFIWEYLEDNHVDAVRVDDGTRNPERGFAVANSR